MSKFYTYPSIPVNPYIAGRYPVSSWTLIVVAYHVRNHQQSRKDRIQHYEIAMGSTHETAVRRTKTVDLTGTRVGLLPASKEGKGKLIKFVVLKEPLSSRQTIRSLKDQDSSSVPIGLSDRYSLK